MDLFEDFRARFANGASEAENGASKATPDLDRVLRKMNALAEECGGPMGLSRREFLKTPMGLCGEGDVHAEIALHLSHEFSGNVLSA